MPVKRTNRKHQCLEFIELISRHHGISKSEVKKIMGWDEKTMRTIIHSSKNYGFRFFSQRWGNHESVYYTIEYAEEHKLEPRLKVDGSKKKIAGNTRKGTPKSSLSDEYTEAIDRLRFINRCMSRGSATR